MTNKNALAALLLAFILFMNSWTVFGSSMENDDSPLPFKVICTSQEQGKVRRAPSVSFYAIQVGNKLDYGEDFGLVPVEVKQGDLSIFFGYTDNYGRVEIPSELTGTVLVFIYKDKLVFYSNIELY